jgi:hypothetical protein
VPTSVADWISVDYPTMALVDWLLAADRLFETLRETVAAVIAVKRQNAREQTYHEARRPKRVRPADRRNRRERG